MSDDCDGSTKCAGTLCPTCFCCEHTPSGKPCACNDRTCYCWLFRFDGGLDR